MRYVRVDLRDAKEWDVGGGRYQVYTGRGGVKGGVLDLVSSAYVNC